MQYFKIFLLFIFFVDSSVFNVVLSQDIQTYKEKFDKYLKCESGVEYN